MESNGGSGLGIACEGLILTRIKYPLTLASSKNQWGDVNIATMALTKSQR